ncbi:MAG: XrtB/PEP-CTERM-associated transcriptional regulator EpsA [Nitrosospira sp.]
MVFSFSPSAEDAERYFQIIQEGMAVRRHYDFLIWLQGEIQHYLPHEIMLAAWGDFNSNLIRYDIVSALLGVRTDYANMESLSPLLQGLFNRWIELDKVPYALSVGESGFLLEDEERGLQCPLGGALQSMRSILIHGISDERGRHDCLYLIFSSRKTLDTSMVNTIEVLLPYIDSALGRITPLPYCDHPAPALQNIEDYGLSNREMEILNYVRMGKTNSEIAAVLGISIFTVKNHLQNIFKKLDVYNRIQAVSKIAQIPADDR